MRRLIRRLKAFFRLDLALVCELSRGMGNFDYHDYPDDYPDDIIGEPWHFGYLTCKRCGKKFTI